MWLCLSVPTVLQALKVLRSAEYAPFVVFIAAPRAVDLQMAKSAGIDVSWVSRSLKLSVKVWLLNKFQGRVVYCVSRLSC